MYRPIIVRRARQFFFGTPSWSVCSLRVVWSPSRRLWMAVTFLSDIWNLRKYSISFHFVGSSLVVDLVASDWWKHLNGASRSNASSTSTRIFARIFPLQEIAVVLRASENWSERKRFANDRCSPFRKSSQTARTWLNDHRIKTPNHSFDQISKQWSPSRWIDHGWTPRATFSPVIQREFSTNKILAALSFV